MKAVRKHQLEGIVAKRAGSPYRSGERSPDYMKWRANRGQEFVIGGYIPNGYALDSFLVGYYDRRDSLVCRSAWAPASRRTSVASYGSTSTNCKMRRCHSSTCRIAAKAAGVRGSPPPNGGMLLDNAIIVATRTTISIGGREARTYTRRKFSGKSHQLMVQRHRDRKSGATPVLTVRCR
jgi:hypothetical protein